MKIRSGFMLRQVMGIYVIMGIGRGAYRPNQVLSVNETGAYLWNLMKEGAERQDLANCLAKEYGIDLATAEKDVDAFLVKLREKALIEE